MSETTENTTTESPKTEKPTAENPTTENPTTENPTTENPTTETVDASTTDTGKEPPLQLNYNVWCPKCEMLVSQGKCSRCGRMNMIGGLEKVDSVT
ncbi:hypothetical protein FPSE_06896 [Fusarium pseudograminearum CS3096]|uniref:Uncharacterized protein n=1 Tax=Fusarium pseudograminearum (strain CS3096) TaxID=1028729 RepID=K3VZR3_FUSPC|nr:hypothetical protein FPSE_06896 [Fusarium pseudograminearum CS3096]EKJ72850.1 hypothetical protein FPSE_06896 [Fusarium pseudograminearum CS3096]